MMPQSTGDWEAWAEANADHDLDGVRRLLHISLPPCPGRRRRDGAHCELFLGHSGQHRYHERAS